MPLEGDKAFSTPGNHLSTFCLSKFAYSRYFKGIILYVWLFVSGFFYLLAKKLRELYDA